MPEEVREVRVGYGCAGAAGGVWLRWCCAGAALVLHTWHRSLPDALQGRALQLVRSWSTARLVPRERALQLGRAVLRRAGAAFAAFAAFAAAVAAGGAFGGATLCCCGSCGRADRQDKSSELEFPVLDFRSGFAVFTVLKQPAEKHAGGGDGGMKE